MYILDLRKCDDGHKEYITQTQKRYFKYALDYAIQNKMNNVKVNRVNYYFDFDKLEVRIATDDDFGYVYKLKKVD